MKKLVFLATIVALISLVSACGKKAAENNSVITVHFPAEAENLMARMADYDTGEQLDSVVVANGVAVFNGNVETPALVRITIDNQRFCSLIREAGNIEVDSTGTVKGGELNARMNDLDTKLGAIIAGADSLERDSTYEAKVQAIQVQIIDFLDNAVKENADNPIGYYYFLQQAYEMDKAGLEESLKVYPQFGNYERIKKLLESFTLKEETGEGKKFKDFEVTYNGETKRFSDYVGKGKYVLVDFWASWCGPCIRETKVIKELLNEYGPKGLEVLGVAVWDEPENTLAAVEQNELPWPQIINAQTIPTDLYGIMAIPSIMLIDPEGTIVSRDKYDEELRQAVAKVFEK